MRTPEEEKITAMPPMTLRDWFAGQVITGMIGGVKDEDALAKCAYLIADAMLKARGEKSEG